jgi:serine/threonine protein kinase, bacterial
MIGQLLAGHYRVLQVLGAGGFGQTYITEDLHLPGNPKCVLKHLKPASSDRSLLELARKLFEKEAIVMQKLGNHDRIPRLLAYFEEQQEFYLVQEYIPGHPLSAELTEGKRWREEQVVELLQEILEILTFIHAQGVIHRDIKPDNIMRREIDRRLILIDFGAIKQVRNQQMLHGQQTMTVAIGTPGYMPIEQASGAPRASSDIYALGKIGIQALTGVNPWDLTEDEHTGELKWEHLTAANPQLIAILQRMTRYHFKDRYLTAEEALQTVNRLAGGTFATTRSGRTTLPQPVSSPSFESQQTVPAYPPAYPQTVPAPVPAPVQKPRRRSSFPIVAGIASIAAAVGSFAVFSSKTLERSNFATDLKTDLCRIAEPTDLPTTRVRSQPQRDAKIIATVPRGAKVVYLEAQDAFIKIQMADNSTGWVYNNQIRGCNTPAATPKPSPTPSVAPPKPAPVPSYPPRSRPTPVPTPVPSSPEPSIPIDVPPPISPTISPTLSPTPTPNPSITPTPTLTPVAPTPTPTPDGASPTPDKSNSDKDRVPTPTPSIPGRARSPIDY